MELSSGHKLETVLSPHHGLLLKLKVYTFAKPVCLCQSDYAIVSETCGTVSKNNKCHGAMPGQSDLVSRV